jgi:putative transposase
MASPGVMVLRASSGRMSSLECELLDRVSLHGREEARQQVLQFIEEFYNTRRRHSSIGCDSPIQFEEKHPDVAQSTSLNLSTETG